MEGKDLISGTEREKKKVEVALAKIKADVGLPEEGLSLPQDAWGVDSGLRCLPRPCPIPPSAALTGSGQLSPSGQLELRSTTCIAVFATTRAVGFDSARCRPAYLVIYELSYC